MLIGSNMGIRRQARQPKDKNRRLSGTGSRKTRASAEPGSATQHTLELSRERLKLMARVTGRVIGTEPLARQAQAMAEEVRAIFKADACVIRLLEGNELVLLAAIGVPAKNLHQRIPLDFGITQEIISHRHPVFIPDVKAHPVISAIKNRLPRSYQFTSYAGTPLLLNEQVIGIFGVYSVRKREDITDADLDCLQIIGNNISVAVVNERLYAELRQQRDRLEDEIKERARAEKALRESEERYRRVVEDQTEFLVRWKPDGTRTFVNESYCRYFGYTREELIGTSFMPLVAEEDRERVWSKIASMTPQNPVRTDEHRVVLPDGRIGWNEWSDRAIFDEHGRLTEFQSVGRDISERKRLQDELLQARKMESIGTLAGGIAHDFGNVLAVVMGNVSVLQREPNLSPRARDLLANIARAAERGSAFTRQLLAYAGGAARRLSAVDLNELVRTATDLLQPLKPDEIGIVLKLEPNLPKVMADAVQIEQVIMNLGLNAIEASKPPGQIEVCTGRQVLGEAAAAGLGLPRGEYAFMQVRDQGTGISEEHLERIFEPFFTTKPMGRGMGLATTRSIVRDHHGQIRAGSVPGNGTMVTVWLPTVPNNEQKPITRRKSRKKT